MRNPGKLLLSKLRPGSTSCKHQQHTNTSTEQNSCTSQSKQNNYTQPNKTATTACHSYGGWYGGDRYNYRYCNGYTKVDGGALRRGIVQTTTTK